MGANFAKLIEEEQILSWRCSLCPNIVVLDISNPGFEYCKPANELNVNNFAKLFWKMAIFILCKQIKGIQLLAYYCLNPFYHTEHLSHFLNKNKK